MAQALSVPLAAVVRVFARDAFSPTVNAIAVRGQQQNATAEGAFEARLEKLDERHLNFTKGDCFYFHSLGIHLLRIRPRIHPLFFPLTEQEFSITMRFAFIAENGQSFGKRLDKLGSISFL